MALNKREFVNGSQPPIDAEFLNELQDAVIDLEENGGGASGTGATETTEVDYGNLSEEEKMADVFYMIPNGVPSTRKAVNTQYDNSTSGLSADNVQGAIDEIMTVEDWKEVQFSANSWRCGVGDYFRYKKVNNVVYIQMNHTKLTEMAYGSFTTLVGLPEGYRPSKAFYGVLPTGNSTNQEVKYYIDENGAIGIKASGSGVVVLLGTITFPL